MQARFIRNLLLLCIGMATGHAASAQDASRVYVEPDGWSIGTNFGMSDLWGNVGTQSIVEHYTNSKYFDNVVFMGGIFGRYTIHPCLAIRFQANFGTLYATDKWNYDLAKSATTQGDDAFQRYARDQDVKDYVFEATTLFELDPFRLNPESKRAGKRGQPYIATGVSIFHFNPYSTVANTQTWVPTYNLDLEGQGFGKGYPPTYSLWQPAIPLAIGYRWDLGEHLNLGVEYMWRYCFTKYLDGVSGTYISNAAFAEHLSPHDALLAEEVANKTPYTGLNLISNPGDQRGNPGVKDSYSTISIVFYYKVHNATHRWWH